jgi:P-type Ca2+ transporter type 2C
VPEGIAPPAAAPDREGVVRVVHMAVPGRVRLHVRGLHRSPALQSRLAKGLARSGGVRSSWPSVETGNLLVSFDPSLPMTAVLGRVTHLASVAEPDAEDDHASTWRWHALDAAAVAGEMGTSLHDGLTDQAAQDRLAAAGPNRLPEPVGRSSLEILAGQFQTLPTLLLAGAGLVSLLTGGLADAAAIFAVLALNGGIGYTVESRSEHTIRNVRTVGAPNTTVVRQGQRRDVPIDTLVPGDVIQLARDTTVPADARICRAEELLVDEALLTGESVPREKTASVLSTGRLPVGARRNMVYRGTAVVGGAGAAVVVATGAQTEIGRTQQALSGTSRPATPMERELDVLGRQLTWLSLAFCGAVAVIGLIRGFGLAQLLRSSIALAIAAIPEGLPTVASTTLARGVEVMRRRDVIVRRLDAVETLGAVQVLCFDKTGTLTFNRMSVAAVAYGTGSAELDPADVATAAADPSLRKLLEIAVLCSEVAIDPADGTLTGSQTEVALVRLAQTGGVDGVRLRQEWPMNHIRHRSEAYRFMATTHVLPDGTLMTAIKGDPLDILTLCSRKMGSEGDEPLDAGSRAAIQRTNAAMAGQALRVLGFAYRINQAHDGGPLDGLVWVGLAGLADAVRPSSGPLVNTLQGASIHPLILTGDQVATARAIAGQLGLKDGEDDAPVVVDSIELDRMAPDELAAAARQANVFARVSPAEKLRIVQALQQAGVVVGMVGDGFNDSPALKAADVGIAIGETGTEAARNAADIVMQTEDLGAIAVAVEQGRAAYANVRRATSYLVGTNLSEMIYVLAGTALGSSEPLSAAQLLWINIVSDVFPAVGLAYEPPEPFAMDRPPRPRDQTILGGENAARLATEGGMIAAGALASSTFGALQFGSGPQARTMGFGSLVLGQLLHTLNRRNARAGGPTNAMLIGALSVAFGTQALALVVPGLRRLLGIAPLGPAQMAVTLAGGVVPYLANRMLRPDYSAAAFAGPDAASVSPSRSLASSN